MLFSLFISLVNLLPGEGITVDVKRGFVKGYLTYAGEHPVYAFKNIPYAKPPVGDLRFQLPRELDGWYPEENFQRNGKVRCPQNAFYEDEVTPYAVIGQEDCLVLDVYVRQDERVETSSLPVLVYFHGGKFMSGSKEDYGPDYLLRYNDIILVVPNYRLGVLGFLSFQDATLPGNLGLWDQNAALRWVSENIDQFGGDPNKVTISGHEAGAASVGLHILAPISYGYFERAISDSGTALSPWLVDSNPSSSVADRVVDALKCSAMSIEEKLKCLKTAHLYDILKVQEEARKLVFVPTIDFWAEDSFIPYTPKSLYMKGYQKDINYLVGYAEQEAAIEVAREFPNVLKYQHLDKMIQHFLKPHFMDAPNFEMIVKAAKYHYMRGAVIPTFESIEFYIARIMTDFLYRGPLEQVVEFHRQKIENVFVYIFKPTTDQNTCGLEHRSCFGNEFYVFNMTSRGNDFVDPDKEGVIETLSKIWGNFIKFGYPDVDRKWEPYNKDGDRQHYAEISDIVRPKINLASEDGEFWISLVSELNAAVSNASVERRSDAKSAPEYSSVGKTGIAALSVLFGILCIALVGVVVVTKRRTLTMSIVPKEKFIS